MSRRDELEAILVPLFAERTMAEWTDVLLSHDVLAGPVTEPPDMAADPSLLAAVPMVRLPPGRSGMPRPPSGSRSASDRGGRPRRAWPTGPWRAHRAILAEVGYSDGEIDRLARLGIITDASRSEVHR